MTLDVTMEHIHESNLIESIDDLVQDEQLMEAWRYLAVEDSLNRAVLRTTQRLAVLKQPDLDPGSMGSFRSELWYNVRVGSQPAPRHWEVDRLVDDWLLKYATAKGDPWQAHIEFEKIHPFGDGNGRTGRLLLWWHQIKQGKEPSLIKNSTKFQLYYPIFNE